MQKTKICPDCSTEYFSHIDNCADCGTVLLSPEKIRDVQEERHRCKEKTLENHVVVGEGDKNWMGELYTVLIDSGISCVITADAGCNKGCSADTRRLLVSSLDVEKAKERIEEHYAETHPEIQASNEMVNQGKCPACSSPVGSEAVECPDCGLMLLIVKEE